MDKVIVTGLLIIGSVTAAVIVILTIIPSVGTSSQSVVESQREASNRIKTSIEIIAVASSSTGDQVDAWVKNVGVNPIGPIDSTDVILLKLDGTWYNAMTYSTGGGPKTWNGLLTTGDSSWDNGDTLHVTIELTGDDLVDAGDNYRLTVSTPNGIRADYTFSR